MSNQVLVKLISTSMHFHHSWRLPDRESYIVL